ncbi:MEKHLA domain-containing protein [Ectothiorhodospiraceae bacterium BW-2]|nr:MEKHLA domain-containing protein [Ectothiorhodospiraceae bacterium BW-2]
MTIANEPNLDNRYRAEQAELILSTLYRLTGRHLVDEELSEIDRYRSLYEAPVAVLSHNTAADPIFNYANKRAQRLFEFSWKQFTELPSRLSAEPLVREERARLLERVAQVGFIDDYRGVRVSSSGKRFLVEEAIIWNLVDDNNIYQGQAAALYRCSPLESLF